MLYLLGWLLLIAALKAVDSFSYRMGVRAGRTRAATELLRESNRLRGLGVVSKANVLARAAIDLRRSI
jgi:hypothetical protein